MKTKPCHQPTAQNRLLVETVVAFGVPHEQIAAVLNISQRTLTKWYRTELDAGKAKVHGRLVRNLMQIARGRDGTALKATMFILQCKFGWSQYSPPPSFEVRETPLGKKEQANIEAMTAHVGTPWEKLLN